VGSGRRGRDCPDEEYTGKGLEEGCEEGGADKANQDVDDIKHDEGLCPFRKGPDRRVNRVEPACGDERGCGALEDYGPQEGVKSVIGG